MLSKRRYFVLQGSAASGGYSEPKQGSGRRVRGALLPDVRCGYRTELNYVEDRM